MFVDVLNIPHERTITKDKLIVTTQLKTLLLGQWREAETMVKCAEYIIKECM